MSNKKIIPIVFVSNEYFSPYLAVAIQSVIDSSSREYLYHIYILHTDISEYTKKLLENMTVKNIKITCVNIEKKVKQKKLFSPRNYSIEIYYRFLIPEIFSNFEKVLYLDADTLILKDIADLFFINIDGAVLAAALDTPPPPIVDYIENRLSISSLRYFNTGVLLINIKEWNKKNIISKLWKCALTWPKAMLLMPDQDILNFVFSKEKIRLLPWSWNFMMSSFRKQIYPPLESLDKNWYNSVSIIHYSGLQKPWLSGNVPSYFSNLWWAVAKKTNFYNYILWENGTSIKPSSSTKGTCILEVVKNIKISKNLSEKRINILIFLFFRSVFHFIFSFPKNKILHKKKILTILEKLYGEIIHA